MSDNLHQLRCFGCGSRIAGADARADFRCANCGDLFEVEYPGWSQRGGNDRPNPGALKWLWRERRCSGEALNQSGVWRFRELLPILDSFGNAVSLREGNVPLYHLRRSAKTLGIDQLYAKHQGTNPTGSFKDTGMTAALSVAKERGFTWVACASTGNTSASMAAYAARAGMRSLVLIPEGKIAWGKLSQAMDYGAVTCQVKTDFDGCLRLLTEIVRKAPIYLLNSVNPYRLEGQKTPAIEIAEAMDWNVPDHLIVPGGNLGNSSALGKGFREMRELGLIARLPKISVIQAAGANPLVRSLKLNHGAGADGSEHAGDGHPHREPGIVAEVGAGDSREWWMVPGRNRGRDRDCQSGDWRGGAGVRAGFSSDACRAEKAARAGSDSLRRNRGSGADGPHAEGCGLYD